MKPKISIVVTSRNDHHGKDLLKRMMLFIRGLDQQAYRHNLQIELIIVEWNPPSDKSLLHEVLPTPSLNSPMVIRYIIVSNEIHRKWKHHEQIPLYQMIAKNVGIRRALGQFILCTNIDLLFSDELFQFLSDETLDPMLMYRANRCDVPFDLPENVPIQQQLDYCKHNVISRWGFVPSIYQLYNKIRYYAAQLNYKYRGKFSYTNFARVVDTEACGDFTLLSKDAWEEIRGYPELGLYSIHIDSIGCHTAIACGYKQLVLPPDHCTYHLDHPNGWASMDLREKIEVMQDRPFFDHSTFRETIKWLYENNRPLFVNDENWGLIHENLEEINIPK